MHRLAVGVVLAEVMLAQLDVDTGGESS